MGLRNIDINEEYRNLHGSIVFGFYNPLLSHSVVYKRSVGFFSSTALICLSYGLGKFFKNGGHIQLVVSPKLSEEDIEAIEKGYEDRYKIVENALIRSLNKPETYFGKERLNLLAHYIANKKLDIKVAITDAGMYHEKFGIIEDSNGDYVAFSGSLNETVTAFVYNYETIDVFCSWNEGAKRAKRKRDAFENIWNGRDEKLNVQDFPKLTEEIIQRYKSSDPDLDLDERELASIVTELNPFKKNLSNGPELPSDSNFELYDYQKDAIENWQKNRFRGIFDMATGTGKTLTGLGALTCCSENEDHKLAVFIVAPYQHLVEQWVEDIVRFNIKPIIAYSASSQKDWQSRLTKAIRDQKLRPKDKSFFCVATTNATFKSEFMQEQIRRISGKKLLIVDEAHNAGAGNFKKILDNFFDYRLALSATLERHHDEDGTRFLHDYFGEICISYGLERAIKEDKLTPYKYYPIVVYLTDEELDEYKQKSNEILKHIKNGDGGKVELDAKGELLAIERSRIVAGAQEKLEAFRTAVEPYKEKNNLLVYCGATTVNSAFNSDYNEDNYGNTQIGDRQIVAITKILGNEMGMSVARFTSEENIEERKNITQKFKEECLQAIVAIKCLDEGVNIPSIKSAFILASTTNPKEYIQRRGRVLRKWPGKKYAEIFDFITLPRKLETVSNYTAEEVAWDKTLVKNELRRMIEFSSIAINRMQSVGLMDDIKTAYDLTDKDLEEKTIMEC